MKKPTIWVQTRFDTNQNVQPEEIDKSLKFQFEKEHCTICVVKPKALISCAVDLALFLHIDWFLMVLFEPQHEKTGLWGFRPGPKQTSLYSRKRKLDS